MKVPTLLVSSLLLIVISSFLIVKSVHADCDKIYAKVGAGYKFSEQTHYSFDNQRFTATPSKYSARFELGVECQHINFGIAHHSQWTTGAPFNNIGEPYKSEIFIDYRYEWSL